MNAEPATIAALLDGAVLRLKAAGVADPRLDAQMLLGHCLGVDRAHILGHRQDRPDRDATARFAALMARRVAREPVSHLTGQREFWSLGFAVSGAVLDPRPDSETLVEAVLGRIADRDAALRILDLGTGSGCLLLALLSELPHASGVGVDISAEALAVAGGNARALGFEDRVSLVRGDWGRNMHERFNVIVTNPPYIAGHAIDGLAPEVARHEPRLALDGGSDGLEAYQRLGPYLPRLLAANGIAALEIGIGQRAPVQDILRRNELDILEVRRDLGGTERCILAARQA